MGGRKAKTRPRRPTSLEQARNTVANLAALLHSCLEGLNLPSDPVELIPALQELDEDSPPYFAVIYLGIVRDILDPLNTEPDYVAVTSHIVRATVLIPDVKVWREKFDKRRQRSAVATKAGNARAEKYMKLRLALNPEIDKRIITDPSTSPREGHHP